MNGPDQGSAGQESSLSSLLDDELTVDVVFAGSAALGVLVFLYTDWTTEALPPALRCVMAVLCVLVGIKTLSHGWREWTRRRDLREHGPEAERIP